MNTQLLESPVKNKTSSKYLGVTTKTTKKEGKKHYVTIPSDSSGEIDCTYNILTETVPKKYCEIASAITATYLLSGNKKQGEEIGRSISGISIEIPEDLKQEMGSFKYINVRAKKRGSGKVRTMTLARRRLKTLLPVCIATSNTKPFYTSVKTLGNNILLRYINEEGKRCKKEIPFSPSLYHSTSEDSPYVDLTGKPVKKKKFETIKLAKDFISQNKGGQSGIHVYGTKNFNTQFIHEAFVEEDEIEFDPDKILVFNLDAEIYREDGFPSAKEALWPVTMIGIEDMSTGIYYVFGLKNYEHSKDKFNQELNVKYKQCSSEEDLLTSFITFISMSQPDVITGWNSTLFDMVYIVNRCEMLLGKPATKKLSPWNYIKRGSIKAKYGGETPTVDILGIELLDYMDLYKTHTYVTQESYKLDHIAYVELNERKLDFDEGMDVIRLQGVMMNDSGEVGEKASQAMVEYNVKDVALVSRLEEKLGLLKLTFTLSYLSYSNYQESLATVSPWNNICYVRLARKNQFIEIKDPSSSGEFEGGYVKEPTPGMYKNVVSVDLKSLYPHVIQQYNLGAETIVDYRFLPEKLKHIVPKINVDSIIQDTINDEGLIPTQILSDNNLSMAANGQFFKNDQISFLSEVMREFYSDRSTVKQQMIEKEKELVKETDPNKKLKLESEIATLDNNQMGLKILMNSGYGAISNAYFCLFDLRIAEAITKSGQTATKFIGIYIDRELNKKLGTNITRWVYSDTDSCYFTLEDVVNLLIPKEKNQTKIIEFINRFTNEAILPIIEEGYNKLKTKLNAYEQRMFMNREALALSGVWTGKKRYTMAVLDNEGVRYKEPKIKITGMEAVRSSTAEVVRGKLKELYKIILLGDNDAAIELIEEFKLEFMKKPVEAISFPKSVNDIEKWQVGKDQYKSGTPKQVKAAILYNSLIDKYDLGSKYPKITSGSKLKYLDLKKRNPTGEMVIGFIDSLPLEFELHKYIDKEKVFEGMFMKPAKAVLDVVGWVEEETNTLF